MDELNKNTNEQEELENNSAEAAVENETPVQPEDKLMEELEGIRDMLQNELDGKGNEMLIQELDEISSEDSEENSTEEAEDEEVVLCECCGEKSVDTSFGEDYPYCSECRALMKATPIRFTSVFTVVVMIAVAFVSLYFCANSIDDYSLLLTAQEAYSKNNMSDAESLYEQYFQGKTGESNYSKKAFKNFIDLSEKLGYYNYANELITNFVGEEKMAKNPKYANISTKYQQLVATSSAIGEVLGDVLYTNDSFDLEKKLYDLDTLKKDTEKNYNEILIEYYKFAAMNLAKTKLKYQFKQLNKTAELDDGSFEWLYLRNITSIAALMGDIETTQKYADRCLELNAQEYEAYLSLANAYRFCEKPDADKIIEYATKAQEITPSNAVPAYYSAFAVGYLLQGKNEEAVKAMESYMQTQQYTVQTVNLYALCCLAVNDTEGYDEAKNILASGNYDICDAVKYFKEGKFTIEQVLADNGGEI